MSQTLITVAFVAVFGAGWPARAQERIELGGGAGFVGLANGGDIYGDGVRHVGLEVHGTLPITPRVGVDLATTLGRHTLAPPVSYPARTVEGGGGTRTEGLYTIGIRHKVGWDPQSKSYGFVTYGLAGSFTHTTRHAYRETFANGTTYTYPGASYGGRGSGLLTTGFGFESAVARRLSIRTDASLLWFLWYPVGARASAIVVVPLGR